MLKFLFITMMTTHICACFWNLFSEFDSPTWYEVSEVEDRSPGNLYNYCIYFVMTTFTTVGYGDISPKTSYETIYVIVI